MRPVEEVSRDILTSLEAMQKALPPEVDLTSLGDALGVVTR